MRISDWSSDVCSSDLTIADYGLNLQHKFSDRVEMNLDANWTDSSHDVDDMSVFGSTFADQELDITGKLPVLISHKPTTLAAAWAAPNPDLAGATDEQNFAHPRHPLPSEPRRFGTEGVSMVKSMGREGH